ncbi:ribbon-helix-helix protein, CopG family [Intestinibacter bartlettii]|uniref:ribbon-helix-helix protein, CopG family n=1 Tax=Intestinibacter bartlettii TaxID=261299 RepID=UPI003218F67F
MKKIKEKTITIRITEESKKRLKEKAEKDHRTISNVIGILIANYLEEKEEEI